MITIKIKVIVKTPSFLSSWTNHFNEWLNQIGLKKTLPVQGNERVFFDSLNSNRGWFHHLHFEDDFPF